MSRAGDDIGIQRGKCNQHKKLLMSKIRLHLPVSWLSICPDLSAQPMHRGSLLHGFNLSHLLVTAALPHNSVSVGSTSLLQLLYLSVLLGHEVVPISLGDDVLGAIVRVMAGEVPVLLARRDCVGSVRMNS